MWRRFRTIKSRLMQRRTPAQPTDCPDKILRVVSRFIGKDYRKLSAELGISNEVLEYIELDEKLGVEETAFKVLVAWRKKHGDSATVESLVVALEEIERRDIAEKLKVEAQKLFSVSTDRSNDGPNLLTKIQKNLQKQYRGFLLRGLPWLDDYVGSSLEEHFVELEIITKKKNKQEQPKITMQLHEIFQPQLYSEDPPLRVLVEGAAGFGKTTLAEKLCYDYAHQQDYIKQFNLVLFFSLCNFSGDIDEMICSAAGIPKQDEQNLLRMIYSNSVNTLIVLDGYDEVPKVHAGALQNLIHGKVLPHVSLVVTSRPEHQTLNAKTISSFSNLSMEVKYDEAELWDKQVEIHGISDDRQIEFLDKYLSNLSSHKQRDIKRQILKIKEDNVLPTDFLQCPLFLLMIVLLFTEEEKFNSQKETHNLTTRTDLYKNVLNFIMCRYLAKQSNPTAENVDLFVINKTHRPFYVDLMAQFGEFCYTALKNNQLTFYKKEVSSLDPVIIELGILKRTTTVKGFRKVECFEPVHASLIEFAAAYFLWDQYVTQRRDIWKKHVCKIRPTFASANSSVITFLSGLIGNESGAIFEALVPYAAEYSHWFEPIFIVLSKIELTDGFVESVSPSLHPFQPIRWYTTWDCFFTSPFIGHDHPFAIRNKIEIKEMVWELGRPFDTACKIKTETLLLTITDDMLPIDFTQFSGVECNSIVCEFHDIKLVGSKWKGLLSAISRTEFQRISFKFCGTSTVFILLPLMYESIINRELVNAELHCFECTLSEDSVNLMDILNELIRRDRLTSLNLSFDFVPSQNHIDTLLTRISESICLTSVVLWCIKGDQPLVIDLDKLCNNGQKAYKFQHICNFKVEWNPKMHDRELQIELLELNMCCVTNLVKTCRVESIALHSSVLENHYYLIQETLTEVDIVLDETFLSEHFFCCLMKFQFLQVLTLTMRPLKHRSVSMDQLFFKLGPNLPCLKGIEIYQVEENFQVSADITNGLIKYLEERSSTSYLEICVPSLKFLSLFTELSPDVMGLSQEALSPYYFSGNSEGGENDKENIDKFISLVSRSRNALKNRILLRLDVVVYYCNFLQYMSVYKPLGFSSLLDVFPPEEGFVVQYDLHGMKPDDSRKWKLYREMRYVTYHRFSVSFT